SQPALPLKDPAGLEIAPDEIQAVRERLEREDLTVLAYRFEGDRFCTAERFAAYAKALGDRFIGRVLPDSAANTDVSPFFAERVACPHSVVTVHLIDEAGQPTIAARNAILSFFARRLATTSARGEKRPPACHVRVAAGILKANEERRLNGYVRIGGLACAGLLLFLPALVLPAQIEKVVILAAAEERPYISPDLPREGYAAELVRAAFK